MCLLLLRAEAPHLVEVNWGRSRLHPLRAKSKSLYSQLELWFLSLTLLIFNYFSLSLFYCLSLSRIPHIKTTKLTNHKQKKRLYSPHPSLSFSFSLFLSISNFSTSLYLYLSLTIIICSAFLVYNYFRLVNHFSLSYHFSPSISFALI